MGLDRCKVAVSNNNRSTFLHEKFISSPCREQQLLPLPDQSWISSWSLIFPSMSYTACLSQLVLRLSLSLVITSEMTSLDLFLSCSCSCFAGNYKTGSTGKVMAGAEMKIENPNANGDGEICFRGRHVFMGYLNEERKTKEAIDEDGWLHSGDIGRVDRDGTYVL